MTDVVIVALLSLLAELAKNANKTGIPVTWEDVELAVANRKKAVAENKALDPKD